MKLMILCTVLAMIAPLASAMNSPDDAHYDAMLAACELMITLDNVAEEAAELADLAQRRGKSADAKALENLAETAEALADKIDRNLLSPLERGATLAYAKAQLGRLKSDFDLLAFDADEVTKKSRYLEAELDYAAQIRKELKDLLYAPDRGRVGRGAMVSR